MYNNKPDLNSVILTAAIILFVIIVILSDKLSAKGEESDDNSNRKGVEYESIDVSLSEDLEFDEDIDDSDYPIEFFFPEELDSQDYPQILESVGYSTAKLNVRSEPNIESDILGNYYYNSRIYYADYDDNWAEIQWNDQIGYVSKSYVSESPMKYISKDVHNDSRKSFEDYRKLSKSSNQGKLQKCAITSPSGLRKVDNRYCVALGSHYSHSIGQYVDVVLSNGVIIPCIIGDAKADADTSDDNTLGRDGGCVEFIVAMDELPKKVMKSGDCSKCKSDWHSPVCEVRLYNYRKRF